MKCQKKRYIYRHKTYIITLRYENELCDINDKEVVRGQHIASIPQYIEHVFIKGKTIEINKD